ncbi:proline dehydrogenase family protein [Silvibacterium acidisoli]|uniref:proline dehydrogenase family protein n=1 Tax=Acidobacteriaceae bacterium ZG23-2 TaxID=2883246 RepID=UPI00406D152A
MSKRFIAGMRIDDVLDGASLLENQGMTSTLDALGENVHNHQEALRSARVYHEMLDEIARRNLKANVSLKLTQMGMDLGVNVAQEIVAGLVKHAVETGSFVRVDMEGSPYTEATVEMVRELHRIPENKGHVGVVIQAYLYRSEKDIANLTSEGVRVRLCKGAYKEPASVAFPDKSAVDANFVKLMQMLLTSGTYHGIATHDEAMVAATKKFVVSEKIDPHSFEFQMLYGVRRDLHKRLVAEGYNVRIYVPFGPEWYPYFMRRLAERPANVLFILKNLMKP